MNPIGSLIASKRPFSTVWLAKFCALLAAFTTVAAALAEFILD